MMDLIAWDKECLLSLNAHHSQFMDGFMWLATDEISWGAFFILLLITLYKVLGKEFVFALIAITLTVVICDQVSGLFKDWIARPRPSREPDIMSQVHIVNNYRGGKYGFFSSHAANTFGIAVLISFLLKHWFVSLIMISWAALESYSRIYLGVHYPLDIITGIIFGSGVGYGIFYLEQKIAFRFNLIKNQKVATRDLYGLIIAFFTTLFMLLIASEGIASFLL